MRLHVCAAVMSLLRNLVRMDKKVRSACSSCEMRPILLYSPLACHFVLSYWFEYMNTCAAGEGDTDLFKYITGNSFNFTGKEASLFADLPTICGVTGISHEPAVSFNFLAFGEKIDYLSVKVKVSVEMHHARNFSLTDFHLHNATTLSTSSYPYF